MTTSLAQLALYRKMDTTIILVFVIVLSYVLLRRRGGNFGKAKRAPEPGGAWPIIGHLRLLAGGDQLLYRTLGGLADQYGPAFGIRLGTRRAFVVSGLEEARECFTVNDRALASRPAFAATRHMCYNSSMFGFAPYGEYWREMRKIVTLELLSSSRIEKLRHVWEPEVITGITELYSSHRGVRAVVNLKEWFERLTLNMIVKLVAGKRYYGGMSAGAESGESQRFQKAITQFFRLLAIFEVSDGIPFLGWLDRHEKAMKETAKDLDSVLSQWLDEHRARRASGEVRIGTERDFIDVMISVQEEGRFSNFPYEPETCIKSSCLAMILGGSDTTSVTMIWAVSLLLNNRRVLEKAQEELDKVVGPDRLVAESDVENLPYLRAIIKEVFRLYPPGPLLAPREALEDCTIGGYHVPAGTRLIINVWKIQRDPAIWANPTEFKPERFLTDHAHIDLKGQQVQLVPFGLGRRSCPGDSFALRVIHLTLGRLLHGFDLSTPTDQPVDMTESPGMTLPKAVPLEVKLEPRLRHEVYV